MPSVNVKATGVYCILNTVNLKRYVGSAARSFKSRFNKHKRMLRSGTHPNSHLQSAWSRYGENSFSFIILKYCSVEECVATEQKYIDAYTSFDRKFGYNISPTAGSRLGDKHSEEVKLKISKAGRGRKRSAETIAKVAKANTGKKRSSEFCQRVKERQTGTVASRATKKKMSKSQKATWTDERRKQWSAQLKGRKLSKEHVAGLVAANTGRKWNDAQRAAKIKQWETKRRPRVCKTCEEEYWPQRLSSGILCQSKYCDQCRPIQYGGYYKHHAKCRSQQVPRKNKKVNS